MLQWRASGVLWNLCLDTNRFTLDKCTFAQSFGVQSADEDEADEAAGRVREIYMAFSERYMQTFSAL